jgi:hypothetical protein
MSQDLTLKNVPKEVQDAINSATTPSDLREMMLQSMAKAGIIVRTQQNEFDIRRQPESVAPPAVSSLPAARPTPEPCFRVVYPHGNDRYEIYGATEEELNQKEAALRAMYGGQR